MKNEKPNPCWTCGVEPVVEKKRYAEGCSLILKRMGCAKCEHWTIWYHHLYDAIDEWNHPYTVCLN